MGGAGLILLTLLGLDSVQGVTMIRGRCSRRSVGREKGGGKANAQHTANSWDEEARSQGDTICMEKSPYDSTSTSSAGLPALQSALGRVRVL